MEILSFKKEHIKEAMAIALENYYEEQKSVKELPRINEIPDLRIFSENGLGVSAFEDYKMIGFLCCYSPWDHAFGSTAKGTFSPIHAHGAVSEKRKLIYQKLYQAAAEKWIEHQITYHAIAMYAHDKQALHAFSMYGFGIRCVDAIRAISNNIESLPQKKLTLKELSIEEMMEIKEMYELLSEHLGKSPCFLYTGERSFSRWITEKIKSKSSIVYVAKIDQMTVSFIAVSNTGENFVTEVEGMKNICAAFCLSEYRGKGIFQNLLNYVMRQLNQQGVRYLGVDFESFNPTASGVWNKYFTPYTNSIVRRIDEYVLNK